MTIEKLRWAVRWAEKFAAAAQEFVAQMKVELVDAEAAQDPLGLHIYRSRAGYRKTCAGDKSKDGKRIEEYVRRSYGEATALGYDSGERDWMALLRCGKSR